MHSTNLEEEPPVRLCCFERHWGAVCPDGKVMCVVCFERFDESDLWIDPIDGIPVIPLSDYFVP